ncbi:TIGR02679 family protein [Sporomusa sphaeroides]|uniref:TIGR02679 family protein n=1 Tax=Sporomusa sphaeroides TaxID=47679 RepID=UPI002BF7D060|nr:TIGR02679 family protein [Sporomusa sphaeroides]HML34255.1 TIGR02679 family protein [Sporomusa sphaeroides]
MDTPGTPAAAAAAYFRSRRGFDRLLALFIKKYQSLGRLAGRITLTKPSPEEVQALAAFFRLNCDNKSSITISFAQFAAALEQTRFAGADILDIFKYYSRAQLMTNQEMNTQAETARCHFIDTLRSQYNNRHCHTWLNAVYHKAPGTRRAQAAYERGAPENQNLFTITLQALINLPESYERLPLFAGRIAGNPHALDTTAPAGRLFLEALKLLSQQSCRPETKQVSLHSPAEEEAELLYSFHLLRDDLLNFVTCSGLTAFKETAANNRELPYWREAWHAGAVLNVPLRELVTLSQLIPARLPPDRKNVYIVENSGVCSTIIDYFTGKSLPLPPLLCTHGNFKLASWAAIDRLIAGDCRLHYSGDFDPEGLLMADRLLSRHPKQVKLWRYSTADYANCLKNTGEITAISESRCKKLTSITSPVLADIVQALRSAKQAGYQEALVATLIQDMLLAGRTM